MMLRQFIGIVILIGIVIGAVLFTLFFHKASDNLELQGLEGQILAFISEDVKVLEQEKVALQRLEVAKRRVEIQSKIDDIPFYRTWQRRGVVIGVLTGCVAVLVFTCSVARSRLVKASVFLAKVKGSEIPVSHKQLPEMTPILNGLTVAEQLAAKAETAEKALELYALISETSVHQIRALRRGVACDEWSMKPAHPVIEAASVPVLPAFTPSARLADLLNAEDVEPGNVPLGLNIETGGVVQASFRDMVGVLVGGFPNHGKSYLAKVLGVSALLQQQAGAELEIMLIDGHYNQPDALSTFFKPVISLFTKTVLGFQAIEQGEHVRLLETLIHDLYRRQETGKTTPFVLLFIDEFGELCCHKKHGGTVYEAVRELLLLRKFGVCPVVLNQYFTKEGCGNHGTGISGNGCTRLVVNSDIHKARVLLGDDADKAVNLPKGKAVVKLPGEECVIVQTPTVEPSLLTFLNVSQIEPEPEPEQFDVKQAREQAGLSQNELAKRSGIAQTRISRVEAGKTTLSELEIRLIQTVLDGQSEGKHGGVVDLNRYRKALQHG